MRQCFVRGQRRSCFPSRGRHRITWLLPSLNREGRRTWKPGGVLRNKDDLKNYYAILEVPVGCGVAEIRQAYQRLAQENSGNEVMLSEIKEAHEVLTTPARRADYDRAVWGETFAVDGADTVSPLTGPRTPGASDLSPLLPAVLDRTGHCPMGAEAQCPVLLARVGSTETYCPECGYLLAAFHAGSGFDTLGTADAGQNIRLEEPGGQSHLLRPGLNLVGRESADVLLPDKTVSRQHARLEVSDDGAVILEDLSSTNGTQVGGERLVPHVPRPLQAGDRIRFGSVLTELHLSALQTDRETAPAFEADTVLPAAPHGQARAQVVETREDGGRTFVLVPGVTTFGRRAENSVVLQGDPYVSGLHAQIIAEGDEFRLTDIGSTNGTLLNGRRLAINEPETLTPGDVILIGGTALRFELLEAVPSDAEPAVSEEQGTGAEPEPGPPPAEPRERTAPEYDVPEDDTTMESGPAEDSPAHAER